MGNNNKFEHHSLPLKIISKYYSYLFGNIEWFIICQVNYELNRNYHGQSKRYNVVWLFSCRKSVASAINIGSIAIRIVHKCDTIDRHKSSFRFLLFIKKQFRWHTHSPSTEYRTPNTCQFSDQMERWAWFDAYTSRCLAANLVLCGCSMMLVIFSLHLFTYLFVPCWNFLWVGSHYAVLVLFYWRWLRLNVIACAFAFCLCLCFCLRPYHFHSVYRT